MALESIELPNGPSLSQSLYEYLRQEIVTGRLSPRDRLVEQDVAKAAKISRTPVREALRRLEADGLVRESAGRGLEVRGVSPEEIADLCAVRETLEGMASELAAKSASPLELDTLRDILDREIVAADDEAQVEVHVQLNHAFHEALWRASHNRYLAQDLRGLRDRISHMQDTTLRDPDRLDEALTEHRELVQAIADQDGAKAGELARRHFRRAMSARLGMAGAA